MNKIALIKNSIRDRQLALINKRFITTKHHPSTQDKNNNTHTRYITSNSNTGSTAYPSGSVQHPTHILTPPSSSSINQPHHPSKNAQIPLQHRQLPHLPNRRPLQIGIFIIISLVWITFINYSKNSEKFNSSVIKEILFELRNNPNIKMFLGRNSIDDFIIPLKDGYFNLVWIDGHINLMQGSVDVAFRVTGSQHSGKVYFTSVRRDRKSEFEIIRWKLIRDDGEVMDLLDGKNASIIMTNKEEGGKESVSIRSVIHSSSVDHHHSNLMAASQSNHLDPSSDLNNVSLPPGRLV